MSKKKKKEKDFFSTFSKHKFIDQPFYKYEVQDCKPTGNIDLGYKYTEFKIGSLVELPSGVRLFVVDSITNCDDKLVLAISIPTDNYIYAKKSELTLIKEPEPTDEELIEFLETHFRDPKVEMLVERFKKLKQTFVR